MMSSSRRSFIIGAGALVGVQAVSGQTKAAIAPRRGINLHNLMIWPQTEPLGASGEVTYVWPPFATHRIAVWELQRFKALGLDFLRMTVDPAIFLANDEARRADLMKILFDRVEMLNAAGFDVVVDMHPISQNPKYAPARLVDPANASLFTAYCASVARIAAGLQRLGHARVAFEPMNEPMLGPPDFPRWQGMVENMHGMVRDAAPDLPLVMSGAEWDSPRALLALDPRPFKDDNLFYTFHYYEPHTYTHQNAAKEASRYIKGLSWPPREEDQQDVLRRARDAIAQDPALDSDGRIRFDAMTTKLLNDYYRGNNGADRIARDFDAVAAWAAGYNIPRERILLGEFGVQSEGVPSQGRRLWLKTVSEAAEHHGFAWALWVYRGWGGMAFADETSSHALDPDVIEALRLARG